MLEPRTQLATSLNELSNPWSLLQLLYVLLEARDVY